MLSFFSAAARRVRCRQLSGTAGKPVIDVEKAVSLRLVTVGDGLPFLLFYLLGWL